MNIRIMHSNSIFEDVEFPENYLTAVDRYFLMRSHPRRIVVDLAGLIWVTYFLWYHNWQAALSVFVLISVIGFVATRRIDPELMSQTTLGKLGLLHKHPVNLALNIIGLIPAIYGLWSHVEVTLLIGISIVILGHFFGWSKVNSKLRMI